MTDEHARRTSHFNSVSTIDAPNDDVAVTLTNEELEMLKDAVRDADGRKKEVKVAKTVLGIND